MTSTKPTKLKSPNIAYKGETYNPIFVNFPPEVVLIDRAVYGFIRRMELMKEKKSTASASRIAYELGANIKAVRRSLDQLEIWSVILRVYRGGHGPKDASHYVTRPRKEWKVDRTTTLHYAKYDKAKVDRKSSKVDRMTKKGGQNGYRVENKSLIVESMNRVKENPKKKEVKVFPLHSTKLPDVNKHTQGGYAQQPYVPPIAKLFVK